MNRSNRSSDHPNTDAMIAFLICLLATAGTGSVPSRFAMVISFLPVCPKNEFSTPDKFWRTLSVKGFDAFLEVFRLSQAAVAMALQLDRHRQRRVLGIVEQLLGSALRQRRE